MKRYFLTVVALALLITAAPAQALDRELAQVTVDPLTGNSLSAMTASEDGSTFAFVTTEALTAGDGDGSADVYTVRDGQYELISDRVQSGPDAEKAASICLVSDDGTRIVFTTGEPLVAADGDAGSDIYERHGGVTTLISDRFQDGSDTDNPATCRTAAADGTHVVFETVERLVAADTDVQTDVYENVDGVVKLLSDNSGSGTDPNIGVNDAERESADGSHVFFTTTEPLVAADGDASTDVYESGPTGPTLVSDRQTSGADVETLATIDDITPAGDRVLFSTDEPLVAEDGDSAEDVYERSSDGTLSLVSDRHVSGTDADADTGRARITPGGKLVFFESKEQLANEDNDAVTDVYSTNGGSDRLLSDAPAGADSAIQVELVGVAPDNRNAWLVTNDKLVPADDDASSDFYLSATDGVQIVSDSRLPGPDPAKTAAGTPVPGGALIIQTNEALVAADGDQSNDTYEATADGPVLLSDRVAPGADQELKAALADTARGGDVVFLFTKEPLLAGDLDTETDVFVARPPAPVVPPPVEPSGGQSPAGGSPPAGGGLVPQPGGPGAATADLVAPALTGLSISPKKVAAGKQATIRLRLSEPARVALAFTRREAGRRGKGGRCVKPTRKNRKAKKCTRLVAAGTIKLTGKTGANSAKTSKKLKVGSYDLAATAVDAAGNRSKPVKTRFTVAKKRGRE